MKRMHTILVVEDDTILRKFVSSQLRDHGYRVLETSNARDALEIAGRHPGPVHAMLTDIILGGPVDGLELAAEMKRDRPDLRVLYMSGYSGTLADRLDLEALSDFFLAKPFTPKSLLAVVESALAGNPPGQAAEAARARPMARR